MKRLLFLITTSILIVALSTPSGVAGEPLDAMDQICEIQGGSVNHYQYEGDDYVSCAFLPVDEVTPPETGICKMCENALQGELYSNICSQCISYWQCRY